MKMFVFALALAFGVGACGPSFHHYVGDGVTQGVWLKHASPESCKKCGFCDDDLMATVCEDGGCFTDIVLTVSPADLHKAPPAVHR